MLEVMQAAVMLSDIDFMRWYIETKGLSIDTRAGAYAREELKLYEFTISDEAYLAHYNHYEGIFYEGASNTQSVPGWADGNPRYQAIKGMISCYAPSNAKVLDFGCAYGQVTRALAKDFPDISFLGIDHMQEAVDLFNDLAADIPNAHAMIKIPVHDRYDVVIAAEVLEHVIDPYETLQDLKKALKPGGAIITTLPCGPWEAQGYDEHPVGREHLRHWSMNEIREVFGQEVRMQFTGEGLSKEGLVLGSYVTHSRVKDFGRVDMERKLRAYEEFVALDNPESNYWMVN